MAWDDCVARNLYDCTAAVGLDYLQPGNCVHETPLRPVATVDQVVHGRSMSEPDTIKQGWSLEKLWAVWILFFGTSLMVSTWMARKHW